MLAVFCTVIPLWFAYYRSRVPRGFEINHVTLFSFGFLFYWVLPIAVAPIAAEQAGSLWSQLLGSADQIQTYFATALLSYCTFMLGDTISTRLVRGASGKSRPLHQGVLFLGVIPLCIVTLASAIMYRSLLLQPYGVDVDAERARGTIAACVVVLGSIALLYFSDHSCESPRRLLLSRYTVPFLIGCIFLLALGSRLYVVSFVLMLFVYRSCFIRPLGLKSLFLGATSVGFVSGLVGVLRVGDETSNVGWNLILEPMFTSFSLLYYLNYNKIVWLAFPKYLLTDLTNLIPTAFFPEKADLTQLPYVYAPVGALHSFVSFGFNFGIIGTATFMFFVPVILRWVRSRSTSQLHRVCYTMLSGWLAFTFFRDPFSVSLVKIMLEFSVIVPTMIVWAGRAVQMTVPMRRPQLRRED